MKSIYLNVPFVGELFAEVGGVTRARNGRLFDAAKSPGCFELWLGSLHLTLDAPRRRPSLLFVGGVVLLALMVDPAYVGFAAEKNRITYEQSDKDTVLALEFSYPRPQ